MTPRFLGARRSAAMLVLLGAASLVSSPALAAPSDKATAEALFDEARALTKEGKHELACTKLAESQRLDPGIGTLLYLGSCYEKIGKLATAWVTFREASAAAHNAGQPEREKIAAARAAALDPVVPRLSIEPDVSEGDPEILRDGFPVSKAQWGTPVPVDPGTRTIEARMPGRKPRTLTVTLVKGASLRVAVPLLERDEAPPAVSPTVPPAIAAASSSPAPDSATTGASSSSSSSTSTRRLLPFVAAGVGTAGVVVGTIFGVRAMSLASDVDDACPSGPCSRAVRIDADDSRSAGNIATVGFAVGAVGLAAAAVLWLTAPRADARVTPTAQGVRVLF